MWSLFKRPKIESHKPVGRPKTRRRTAPATAEDFVAATTVQEGNTDADWQDWENSVLLRDSQLSPETPPAKIRR